VEVAVAGIDRRDHERRRAVGDGLPGEQIQVQAVERGPVVVAEPVQGDEQRELVARLVAGRPGGHPRRRAALSSLRRELARQPRTGLHGGECDDG